VQIEGSKGGLHAVFSAWRLSVERTIKLLSAFAGAARQQGTFVGTYGLALEAHLHKPPQVVIMGPRQDQGTQALAAAACAAALVG